MASAGVPLIFSPPWSAFCSASNIYSKCGAPAVLQLPAFRRMTSSPDCFEPNQLLSDEEQGSITLTRLLALLRLLSAAKLLFFSAPDSAINLFEKPPNSSDLYLCDLGGLADTVDWTGTGIPVIWRSRVGQGGFNNLTDGSEEQMDGSVMVTHLMRGKYKMR